jgi:hypothetical protein
MLELAQSSRNESAQPLEVENKSSNVRCDTSRAAYHNSLADMSVIETARRGKVQAPTSNFLDNWTK